MGGIFLLAKLDGQVTGTIALRKIAPAICELKRFYVRRERRRKGVGSALLLRLLSHAMNGPWEEIRLDTTTKSPDAVSLFRRNGFTEIPRYHEDPYAEIFMSLRLR